VLSVCTLSTGDAQALNDDLQMDLEKKRYPSLQPSLLGGETKPMRAPGRREIGHGALAERALLPVYRRKKTSPRTPVVSNPFFQRFHLYGVAAPRWR